MKKLLVIAVALASVNAFATRARVNSLANSPHLIDTQTVYSNPADMFYVGGDYVTIESGNTTASTYNDGAEGMVVRSWGDSKAGLSLGHDSDIALTQRQLAATQFLHAVNRYQQNPLELYYGMKAGDMAWAGTLVYSNYKSKTDINEKEDTLGLRAGMRMGALDAKLGVGLANNYANDTDGKFKGTMSVSAGVGYVMDNLYFDAFARTSGYKTEDATGKETSKVDILTIDARVTASHKKDGSEFFYGAGLSSSNVKNKTNPPDSKITSLSLPVWMGLEVDANSWLTLRGSIKQSVLLNDSKTENATGVTTPTPSEFSPGPNNTAVAVGAGLKFNKVTVDGSLVGLTDAVAPGASPTTGAANAKLDGNNLFGTVGLTYMF